MTLHTTHLTLGLHFPTEYLEVLPPIPVRPAEGWKLKTELGEVSVFGDDWDIQNDPGRSEFLDLLQLEFSLTTEPKGFDWLTDSAVGPALQDWISSAAHMDAYNTAMQAGARANSPEYDAWMQKRAELSLAASEAANAWLSDPDVGPSLRDLANFINRIVRRLLEILRVHHGQVVIPDPPRYGIRSVHIRFAAGEDASLSAEVIGRWLEVHTYGIQDSFGRPFEPVEWSEVAARFASEWKPSLIETLLANARSECERRFGNPRLAILEAATVVEILIKSAMTRILSPHAISPTAIDRIVRETSTADLVGIWLRPHVSSELFPLLEDLAVGIRERNELLHHNRRTVSFERAEAFVGAVGRVAEALQHHVPAN